MHPLTMVSTTLLYLQKDSKFTQAYHDGCGKAMYWKYAFEDTLDLLAKIAPIAGYIYRHCYHVKLLTLPFP